MDLKDGKPTDGSTIGEIRSLCGVYSGRLLSDGTNTQLGRVWKKEVIEQTIEGQKLDTEYYLGKQSLS